MKLAKSLFALISMFVLASVACLGQSFSADVVFVDVKANPGSQNNNFPTHQPSRLFVNENKIRLELGGRDGTILLVNPADQTVFALFPAKREYQPLAFRFSEYFRVTDPENACSDWQSASAQEVACQKAGYEIVDGRRTIKYRNNVVSDIVPNAVWIDPELKFVVKWEGAGKSAELRNIHEESQTADLFTVPSDYNVPKPKKIKNKGFSH